MACFFFLALIFLGFGAASCLKYRENNGFHHQAVYAVQFAINVMVLL